MRTSILASFLIFLFLVPPAASQESRPQSRPSNHAPSPAELLGLLSGDWKCSYEKQPNGETAKSCDHVVNEVLPGGRWFLSLTDSSDGPPDMFLWEFQALEVIPETGSVSGVVVHGRMRDVRLLQGWITGRHLIVNELSERRTYTMDSDTLVIDREEVDSTGRRMAVYDENGRRSDSITTQKLIRVKRPRGVFEAAPQVSPPSSKLDEALRQVVGNWKFVSGKNVVTGTKYSGVGLVNTLLPGGWVASVSRTPPDSVHIILMGVDPRGNVLVGVELASERPTAALVSGYLEEGHVVTRISGAETVWQVEDRRMTRRERTSTEYGNKDFSIFEFTRE